MHPLNSLVITCKCFVFLYLVSIVLEMCVHTLTSSDPANYSLNICDDLADYCDYVNLDVKPNLTEKNFSILQLNIRGILGKQSQLSNLLKQTSKHSKTQVVLLQETWLKKGTESRVKISGYAFVGSHRKHKKGGGVGILVPKRLQYRIRKDLTLDIPGFENITVEIKTHSKSIIVSSLYRPPNCKEKEFLKNYKRWLNKFSVEEERKLITGIDHNLDLIKNDKHKPTKEFLEIKFGT